jgi:RHH-type proline utilization regulon transcriptional repressor/proline dehydrogenase/delta 1-pyrroline-5-carboxylate dehydrogenase
MTHHPPSDAIGQEAVAQAAAWHRRALQLMTAQERKRHGQLARIFASSRDRLILSRLIDQSFRSVNSRRVADQIGHLIDELGIPSFFSPLDKTLLALFTHVGRHVPRLSVPRILAKMRRDSRHVILSGDPDELQTYLRKRRAQGLRVNVNYLGEALLGESDALHRMDAYCEALKNPEIDYISVKISTIFSQIQPLALDRTVSVLKQRLTRLYRAAMGHPHLAADGRRRPKFVNLDMENYHDLEITAAAFIETLEQPEFKHLTAGMALQAYLPDSFGLLREITAWARRRVAAGGSPVKVRIVKGANMETEQVEAEIAGWPLPTYGEKGDTDANYKRMLQFAMRPENIKAVRIGVASHNLFDLAYADLLARRNRVERFFSFEMLEGMANHVRRALQETGREIVLYAPVAAQNDFVAAIGYLIRRLDENTGHRNFLRHVVQLETNSRIWQYLAAGFAASLRRIPGLRTKPYRTQNRLTESFSTRSGTYHRGEFRNEPNTDWSLAANRRWAEKIRTKWRRTPQVEPIRIPVVVGGHESFKGRRTLPCRDPSQYKSRVTVARFALANARDVDRAVAVAKADPDGWRKKSLRARHRVLSRVAVELRRARGDLIGVAAANTGKVFTEADAEVSEAVDFAEYYPFSLRPFEETATVQCRGKGVGLVISPWNFPIAIPCGGITAALAAGNTVVFKPSSEAVLVAWLLCRCFWRAGISRNVLQFVPCKTQPTAERLVCNPDVDFIILTGGTATGLKLLQSRPDVLLAAETGGKNATVVTAMADRDQAIADVVFSAFGNSGQKCSATSLLVLEKEVYQDDHFRRQLIDAAHSFQTGSAWKFASRMGPLIRPPAGKLQKALTELQAGESWALKPENLAGNPHLWSPAVKWDVQPGSETHLTEFFGPVLGVMCADNLEHAVQLVNRTGYGLTAGLQSLDAREQTYWKNRVHAGNLYINRGTTGAVTLRQPFGGTGKSVLGPGMKAGGPKYVVQFMDCEEIGLPPTGPLQSGHRLLHVVNEWQRRLEWQQLEDWRPDLERTIRAVKSYLYRWEQEFGRGMDYFRLRGQDNILRYRPVGTVVIRLHPEDTLFEVLGRVAAGVICGCRVRLSVTAGLNNEVSAFLHRSHGRRFLYSLPLFYESDRQLIEAMPSVERIRYAAARRVPAEVLAVAADIGLYIARAPVMAEGALELLHYLRQQSLCHNYHRYGNLGERVSEYLP